MKQAIYNITCMCIYIYNIMLHTAIMYLYDIYIHHYVYIYITYYNIICEYHYI